MAKGKEREGGGALPGEEGGTEGRTEGMTFYLQQHNTGGIDRPIFFVFELHGD